MLNIYFGEWEYDDDRYIWDPNGYFDINYETEWIDNNISKQIIKDIDKCDAIGGNLIECKIFGVISPKELSGGSKLLILMNIEGKEYIYNGDKCGPNCSDWILRLSKDTDIFMNRNYPIKFSNEPFKVKIINDESIVTTNKELLYKIMEYRDSNLFKDKGDDK